METADGWKRNRLSGEEPLSARPEPDRLPVVGELQGDAEVGLLQQRDDRLEVILLLGADPQLVALDLGLHALRALVADPLADRLGLVRLDALDDLDVDPVSLPGLTGLPGVQRLQRDVPLDRLLLEHVERRPGPVLGLRLHEHQVLARVADLRAGTAEVEPGAQLLAGLVERVVELLMVDLADDVERWVCHVATPVREMCPASLPPTRPSARRYPFAPAPGRTAILASATAAPLRRTVSRRVARVVKGSRL